MKKLLLVDGSSVAVPIFYALGGGDLVQEDVIDLEGAREFLQKVAETTVENVKTRIELDGYQEVRIALEAPWSHPSWRYSIYKDYKQAESKSTKPRIAQKLQPLLNEVALRENIQTIFALNYEADDVIATMVDQAGDWTGEIHVWSLDKDLNQILGTGVVQIGKKGKQTTHETVREEWGVEPRGVPLVKALVGDQSDNVPGVKGLGVATVSKFIRPAPFRKPSPYWISLGDIPEKFFTELTHVLPRVVRDEKICTLSRTAKLLPGDQYYNYL